jgi:hypothetical protein
MNRPMGRKMKLDDSHPWNQGVLNHLRSKREGNAAISPPDRHPDPYMKAGSHPDVVSYVWDTLGASLPVDCRAIIYGTPGLVQPEAGLILTLSYGTSYVLKIPVESMDDALKAGCTVVRQWTGGEITDLSRRFGAGWVFGAYGKKETGWLRRSFDICSGAA